MEPKASIFRTSNQEKLKNEIKLKETQKKTAAVMKKMIFSKLFLREMESNNEIIPDFEKFFEIQNAMGHKVIALFLNSEDFIELDEQYNNGFLNFNWT